MAAETSTNGKGRPKARARSARPAGPDRAGLVVGIGASAGGLEAFKAFFSTLPADTGMAFILIQHLDPAHESALVTGTRYWDRVVEIGLAGATAEFGLPDALAA